jgi:alpha-tubulin suppressor-like RCC1 family protein
MLADHVRDGTQSLRLEVTVNRPYVAAFVVRSQLILALLAVCFGSGCNDNTGPKQVEVDWVARLAVGYNYTCGVTTGGAAYCWGRNDVGQLGDGTFGNARSTPVLVGGGLTFIAISAGQRHTCALTTDGSAYCWGDNTAGELGTATAIGVCPFGDPNQVQVPYPCSTAPVPVAGGLKFVAIVAGGGNTCGLTSGGTAFCWGSNANGELGTNAALGQCSYPGVPQAFPCSTTPVPVAGSLDFVTISGGGLHSCGLTASGAAYCWGYNSDGQLGDGTATDRINPVAVSGAHAFQAISAGGFHTCAVAADGSVYCWGQNIWGQLGNGDTSRFAASSPVAVEGGLVFQSVSAGMSHTCGVTRGGAVYCWGDNQYAQLGTDAAVGVCTTGYPFVWSTPCALAPVPVAGPTTFRVVNADGSHTCALTGDGVAYCWGYNDYGEVGDGTTWTQLPVPVSGGLRF